MMTSFAPLLRDRDAGWTRTITAWLVMLFVVEMLLAGPGYWHIAVFPVRRTLVAALTLWMVLMCALGRVQLRDGHIVLIGVIGLVMTLWIVLIPAIRSAQPASDAIKEGFPLALLFGGVLAHAYYRDNPLAWAEVRRTAGLSLGVVAILAIIVWIVGALIVDDPVFFARGFLNYFTLGSENFEPSVYVQQMPDGFFRVMWITSTVLPVGLLYSLARRKATASLLFLAALFVSYTRALWLCAAIGLLWMALRYLAAGARIRINFALVSFLLLTLVGIVGADLARGSEESVLSRAANRLVTTFSDESANERVDQVAPLIAAWLTAPVLGLGMGSSAAFSRSDVAPYLYELTYLALLMKMGVIGVFILMAIIVALMARGAAHGARVAHIEASLVAFLLACSTNPYLLNLVGLSLLVFLFIELDLALRRREITEN